MRYAAMAFQINPNLRRNITDVKLNKQTLICVAILSVLILFLLYWGTMSSGYGGSLSSVTKNSPAVTFSGQDFVINGKKTKLLSGSIHYFRVVPSYWEDRMKKLMAMGLNTVETYVAWNMHEPMPGKFDFTGILDIQRFIRIAKRLGLHVIVRPGPYICAEWDNGGLPHWLLHDPNMKVRTTYQPYQNAVERFFTELFKILEPLQAINGGPIIAFQVENEYAGASDPSKEHMVFLYNLIKRLGVVELLVTSDSGHHADKSKQLLPHESVLMTVNFQSDPTTPLQQLKSVQPNKPMMVMEYWPGWFDHWGQPHLSRNVLPNELASRITTILEKGASFNLYMFHGGTNFGFMNGANIEHSQYRPDVTSYDYDAPLNEAGDPTTKYSLLRQVLVEHASDSITLPLPDYPLISSKAAYGEVQLTLYLKLVHSLDYAPMPFQSDKVMPMEYLPVNDDAGQGFGYIMYRTTIPSTSEKVTITSLNDVGVALLDYEPISMLSSFASQSFLLQTKVKPDEGGSSILDLLVENCGRVNYGSEVGQRKGINGEVLVDGAAPKSWKIYSFELKRNFIDQIMTGGLWSRTPAPSNVGPAFYKGDFSINEHPRDTFIDMKGWTKGVVFVNGVNLGRYWNVGPQQTLYVPGPLLKQGINKILIFEIHRPKIATHISFVDVPILNSNIDNQQ